MDKKNVSQAVLWSAVDIFFRYGVNFIIIVFLMRLLNPEAFGVIAMLGFFTSVASLFIDGGMSQALIQRQNTTHIDESSIFFLNLLMGLVIALVLCLSAPLIVGFYKEPILREIIFAMALSLFINAFGSVHTSLLTKNLNFKVIAKVGMVASLISGLIALAAAYNGLGVWSLVIQILSASFLTVIMLWILHPWRPKWVFSFLSIRSFWGFSGYLMLSGLLYRIYDNVFAMVIGRTYSAQDAGFYAQAQRLQQLPIQLLTSIISRVAFPAFSSSFEDKEKLVRGLRKAIVLSVFMSVPIAVYILLLAEPLVLVLFGDKWLPSVPVLQMLSLAAMLMPIQMLNITMLKALGRTDLNVRVMVLKFLLGMGLLWITLPFGIVAIAGGYSLTTVINVFINAYYTKKILKYGAWQQLKDIYLYVLAGIAMSLIVLAIKLLIVQSVQMQLLISILVGSAGYLLVCWYTKLEAVETLLEVVGINK